MIKKTISYTDYNGNERTEDFYFDMSEAEIVEMQFSVEGGMQGMLEKIIQAQDNRRIIEVFKDLIRRSYGEKSLDGKRFVKSEAITEAFMQTPAYSIMFMELATNDEKAAAFLKGIVPPSYASEIEKKKMLTE